MALAVGSRLGHYDVTALIGEGGMGQVYRRAISKHPVPCTPVARVVLLVILGWLASAGPAAQGHGEEVLNSRLVGAHDLQARSAYQPLPVVQAGRYILYVGHHAGESVNPLTNGVEVNGTSIVDVTNPARPVYLHHIPATGDAQGAQMVQVCAGADLPNADVDATYLLRANGNESHELWDVSVPEDPPVPDDGRADGAYARWPTAHAQDVVGSAGPG